MILIIINIIPISIVSQKYKKWILFFLSYLLFMFALIEYFIHEDKMNNDNDNDDNNDDNDDDDNQKDYKYNVIITSDIYEELYDYLNNLFIQIINHKLQENMMENNEFYFIKNFKDFNECYFIDKISDSVKKYQSLRMSYLEYYFDIDHFHYISNLFVIVKI